MIRRAEHYRGAVVLATAALLALTPAGALAWGPLAHQIVYRAAIARVRSQAFREWLARNGDTGARQSMSPDIDWKPFEANDVSPAHRRRMRSIGPGERPAHFFDADLLLPSPADLRALQNTADYEAAVPILREILRKNPNTAALADKPWELGSVPWRMAQLWTLLVRALRQKDFPRAQLYAAALTHYAAEHTNPLHADSRYDGLPELTGGEGLHLTYEMHGFEALMEARGAVRPATSRGVWGLPSAVLSPFAEGAPQAPVLFSGHAVRIALGFVAAGRPAVESLSKAYGEARGADGKVDSKKFFATPIQFAGFQGTVAEHAEQNVAAAAAFSAALLDGAYLAATQGSAKEIPFPTDVIAFDRQFVVDNYPPPPGAATAYRPFRAAASRVPCLIDLIGLLAP